MAEDEVTYDEDEAYLAVTMTISLATKPSTAAGPGPATGSRPPGRPPAWLTGSRGKHHGRSGKRS